MRFDVYEKRKGSRSYIGSVEAETYLKARDKARRQYGAPIEIERNQNH